MSKTRNHWDSPNYFPVKKKKHLYINSSNL